MTSTSNRMVSMESEQAVLGSMLIDSDCIKHVAARLRETDFTAAINQEIYRTIVAMHMDGKPVDGLTVAAELQKREPENAKTARAYLAQLIETTPTAANVMEYVQIAEDCGRRRALREALAGGLDALERGEDETELIRQLDGQITDATQRAACELLTPAEQLDRFYAHRERIDDGKAPYVRTGIPSLDRMLGGGMVKKGLYFLAGRPGMGKTALGIAIAEYAAKVEGRVDFFSMEMSADQLTARRVAAMSKINSNIILTQTMTEAEYRKTSEAASVIAKTPLYITDGMAHTIDRLSAIARANKGCKLVVVDHFSLFLIPGRQQNNVERAAVAHGLKRLAQALDVPVLCLAQLNRENEGRTNKRPKLSDLRETGAAEEDADGVILIHRDDYYDSSYQRKPQEPVLVDAILAKNRHGQTGTTQLSFWPETNTFRERFTK